MVLLTKTSCDQIGCKFCCIPLGEISKFLGVRKPVRTLLNVDMWRYYLADYFGQQLPNLCHFRFPLDSGPLCY